MIIENQGLNEKKYTEKLLQEIKDNQWERLAGGDRQPGPTSRTIMLWRQWSQMVH